ncbi:anti-sigma factor domain-containing protein [Amnibacterium endophyticum]|uniref:Regulator of SigK n=1 Tax=Amnibacterium endophyticum TaxID=2109337 RepID=A0ABW4LEL5_9MICO
MNERQEIHLLSGAYALDAVTDEERAALLDAMRESEELRGEVVGLTDTAVALGLSVAPVAPRPALRAALLEAIEHTPQDAPVQEPEPRLAAAPHVAPRRRRRLLRRPSVLLAAAAVAVLLFGGGVIVQRALVQPDLQYSAIVAGADGPPVVREVRGGGEATLYSSRDEGGSAIVVKGVDVPEGRVLQVWSVQGDRVVSAGLYETGDHYRVIEHVPVPGERIAVSVEPAGGSEQPTTRPIVALPVTA